MEVLFIGTGGGRINLLRQMRGTGGFIIKGSRAGAGNGAGAAGGNSAAAATGGTGAIIHVDPGPGALINMLRLGQDPLKTDAVIVTHCHIDHCNDAALMIEGMSEFALKKKGILIASKGSVQGTGKFDKSISGYHQSKVSQLIIPKPGESVKFRIKESEIALHAIPVHHDEETGFGFRLFMDGQVLGYTSDTEYFEGLAENFKGCDLLVVNNLKPFADGIPDHLASDDVVKLLKIAKPKIAVLSHLGMKFKRGQPELEAEKISHETGVHTIAGHDGMGLDLASGKVLIYSATSMFDAPNMVHGARNASSHGEKAEEKGERKLSEFE